MKRALLTVAALLSAAVLVAVCGAWLFLDDFDPFDVDDAR